MSESYLVQTEPFYSPQGNEIEIFEAAWNARIPVMLKGPTGSGKTRFIEHMCWRLKLPLITVSCHEDMTGTDLLGRFLLEQDRTKWVDGPLTTAARIGSVCYLDEIVEARQDTTVVIHSLTDDRRLLSIEKKGELLRAHDDFFLVVSYNPGYQSILKDLKESTKQRFVGIDLNYPEFALEVSVVAHESGVSERVAESLVKVGELSRNLVGKGVKEGASTRCLIAAGKMISSGFSLDNACESAVANVISDDVEIRSGLMHAIRALPQ
jgi:nitric oxide reductase NorQ protein